MALSIDERIQLRNKYLPKKREAGQGGGSQPGFLSETAQDVREVGTGISEDFQRTTEDIGEGIASGQNPISTGLQFAGGVGRTIGSVAGRAVEGIGKAVLPQRQEEQVGQALQSAVTPIVESEIGQGLIGQYQELETNNPEAARNLRAGLGIVEGLATLGGGAGVGSATRSTSRTVGRGVSRAADDVGSGISSGTSQTLDRLSPAWVKTAFKKVPAGDQEALVDITAQNLRDSLITTKSTVNKIEKLAAKQGIPEDDLLRQFVREGGIPRVDDELARFDEVIQNFEQRQTSLAQGIDELLARQPERTDLNTIKQEAESVLRTSPQIGTELDQSLNELDRFFNSLENRFGSDLSARELNQLRVQMNQKTGAFRGEKFTQDTEDAIADVTRSRINEISEDGLVRRANAEWGKLQNMKRVASTLSNQKIKVNDLINTLGSFGGTLTASATGFSVGGPGGLVAAYLAARTGSDALAGFIRSRKFSDELKDTILQGVRQDEDIVQQLIRQADEADRAILERKLLPEPAIPQPARGQRTEPEVRTTPAQEGEPGINPQTGEEVRTFRSD